VIFFENGGNRRHFAAIDICAENGIFLIYGLLYIGGEYDKCG